MARNTDPGGHGAFLSALGGQTAVARLLGLKPSVVSNWPRRGISHRWRHELEQVARVRGIPLPANFFPRPKPLSGRAKKRGRNGA